MLEREAREHRHSIHVDIIRERERERERDRETERETETDRQTDRQTEKKMWEGGGGVT